MFGYTGRSLRVDLTACTVALFATPPELIDLFLGGRGMAVGLIGKRYLLPWSAPEMPLVFASGPLVGTRAPTSGRSCVASRSPLTGTVCDASVGGRFGTELKKAGFDLIEIVGQAERWTVLRIENNEVRLEDGSALAGLNVAEARTRLGRPGSDAVIGIAGEKGVLFSSVVFDGHYLAGRGGLGAVMGAKRLKAVAITGSSEIQVADVEGLRQAREEIMRLLRASQAVFGELGLAEFGTAALVDLIHARRMEPTRNFRETFHGPAPAYSGYHLREKYGAKKTGCRGCPVLCKKIGRTGEVIPEFETVSHFGALNGLADVDAIVEANRLCNTYGLDTISTASTIACHAEVSGTALTAADVIDLIHRIGVRSEGLGEALSIGSRGYAERMGRPGASMSVKGLELPAYDPRGAYGMALSYATSNRGGCHLRAYPISHEILRKPVATDRFSFEGKARMVKIAEDMNAAVDSLTACKFVFFAATLEEYAKALSSVTGRSHTAQSLLKTGERIYVLERHLNCLNGFSRDDDDLPSRFFEAEGSSSQAVRIGPIDRSAFHSTVRAYYRARGYSEDGIPGKALMESLGLSLYLALPDA